MVVMIDVSMACTVSKFFHTKTPEQKVSVGWVNRAGTHSIDPTSDSGSFDGTRLLWDVPQFVPPLVGEGAGFESRSISLGVEGLLLDESTAAARGFSVVQKRHLLQIGVPFGAEGGYRKVQSVLSKRQGQGSDGGKVTNSCKTRTAFRVQMHSTS